MANCGCQDSWVPAISCGDHRRCCRIWVLCSMHGPCFCWVWFWRCRVVRPLVSMASKDRISPGIRSSRGGSAGR